MREYTPTMAQVRQFWASDGALQPAAKSYDFEESAAEFDRFIADVKADAWDEGLQVGWEECQSPGPFVNDWWDSEAPNPYRIERETWDE